MPHEYEKCDGGLVRAGKRNGASLACSCVQQRRCNALHVYMMRTAFIRPCLGLLFHKLPDTKPAFPLRLGCGSNWVV